MDKIQVVNPHSGYYELYNKDGDVLERQKERYKNVPVIGEKWRTPTPEANTVIKEMSDELTEIKASMDKLAAMGFSMELMEIFIYKKTSVNLREVRKVLQSQKEFLNEAFKPVD